MMFHICINVYPHKDSDGNIEFFCSTKGDCYFIFGRYLVGLCKWKLEYCNYWATGVGG